MSKDEYIKMWLEGDNIEEFAKRMQIPKGAETQAYYTRFLDVTTVEVQRILRTKALYEESLADEERELLEACEFAQDKLDKTLQQ